MDYLRVCGYFTVVDRGSAGEYILAFRQTRAYDIPFWVEEFPARLPNGTETAYCTRRKVRVEQVGRGTNFDIGSVGTIVGLRDPCWNLTRKSSFHTDLYREGLLGLGGVALNGCRCIVEGVFRRWSRRNPSVSKSYAQVAIEAGPCVWLWRVVPDYCVIMEATGVGGAKTPFGIAMQARRNAAAQEIRAMCALLGYPPDADLFRSEGNWDYGEHGSPGKVWVGEPAPDNPWSTPDPQAAETGNRLRGRRDRMGNRGKLHDDIGLESVSSGIWILALRMKYLYWKQRESDPVVGRGTDFHPDGFVASWEFKERSLLRLNYGTCTSPRDQTMDTDTLCELVWRSGLDWRDYHAATVAAGERWRTTREAIEEVFLSRTGFKRLEGYWYEGSSSMLVRFFQYGRDQTDRTINVPEPAPLCKTESLGTGLVRWQLAMRGFTGLQDTGRIPEASLAALYLSADPSQEPTQETQEPNGLLLPCRLEEQKRPWNR